MADILNVCAYVDADTAPAKFYFCPGATESTTCSMDQHPCDMPGRKVLQVGGDAEIYALLRRTLELRVWNIATAVDNEAALALLDSASFDLIITDQKTPGKQDVELLRQIRRRHPHTRVIILTDETTPADVIAAIREHAFSYFSKPFCVESLGAMIHQVGDEPAWDDGLELVFATPEWVRIQANCDLKTADRLLQFFREIIVVPESERESVGTALRELLLNAIEHGAKFNREKLVEMSYMRTQRAIACRIKDPGEGFSLKAIPHSAIMNPPDDPIKHVAIRDAANLRPGGFGLLVAQAMIDEVIYNERGNEVVLIKHLPATEAMGA